MDDTTLTRLRSAGAMIGETNLASWSELVAVFQDTGVAFGIANAKREFQTKSVTATQCAKALRHKLKCLEPARKAGEALVPNMPPVVHNPALDGTGTIVAVAETRDGPRVVGVATVAEEEPEHEPTDAKRRVPPTPWMRYVEILRAHPGITARQIGDRLGRSASAVDQTMRNHRADLEWTVGKNNVLHYRLKGTPAPAAPVPAEDRPAPAPAAIRFPSPPQTAEECREAVAQVEAKSAEPAPKPGPLCDELLALVETHTRAFGYVATLEQLRSFHERIGGP
jgi:hypothetical protein